MNELCTFLPWDTEFFGFRVATVTETRLDALQLRAIEEWCRQERIDCLYYLAESNDGASVPLVESNDFHLVDIRVTFERFLESFPDMADAPGHESLRLVGPADTSVLKKMARVSYRDTRFYYDLHFPRERCDALYEVWIEKSINGWANAVLVADIEGQPAANITCHKIENHTGQIGLAGVHPDHQGKGLGKLVVNGALDWFKKNGLTRATVVTQGRNVRAQRLYEQCGFFTQRLQLRYHRWFTK